MEQTIVSSYDKDKTSDFFINTLSKRKFEEMHRLITVLENDLWDYIEK